MSAPGAERQLDDLVRAVRATGKYGAIGEELIRNVGRTALATHSTAKAALKETKGKLHQVAAAYMPARSHYDQWVGLLARVRGDPAILKDACRTVLAQHTSTRERLALLDSFYIRTMGQFGIVDSVLDLACGYNPLTAPWMPLTDGATYNAYDVYTDLVSFLSQCLFILGLQGCAKVCDVTGGLPTMPTADVALLLKALPCLEQIDRPAVVHLLDTVPARHLLVSFPVHSLGGADRRMTEHYAAHFRDLMAERRWSWDRVDFATELVFVVEKGGGH
jgi:16S rRNA (guanine(1405)-N(7))-methyltransferase